MNTNTIVIIGVVIVALALGAFVILGDTTKPVVDGTYDTFAQCLGEKGATFYGAFWCPHCQKQKALFGSSASKLPYVECSTPDGNAQFPICIEKGIKNYPTWKFADGSERTGEVSLADLSAKTECPLPDSAS